MKVVQDPTSPAHPQIDKCKNEIRLLQFDGAANRLSSRVYGLDDRPEYTALSYTWGKEDYAYSILLNGNETRISTNLNYALESLHHQYVEERKESTATMEPTNTEKIAQKALKWAYLWIDALCIDQDDLEERSHQVQLMSQIYRSACQVAVWPGRHCGSVFTLINRACDAQVQLIELLKSLKARPPIQRRTKVSHFISSGYWVRAWVVPELLLAREIIFISGERTVTSDRVEEAISNIYLFKTIQNEHVRPWEMVAMLKRRSSFQKTRFFSLNDLHSVLYSSTPLLCKDSKDRIYSLLGLIDWSLTPGIEPLRPNYAISKEELVSQVVSLSFQAGCDKESITKLAFHFYQEWGRRSLDLARELTAEYGDPET